MITRFLMISMLAIVLTACETTSEEQTTEQVPIGEREDITAGPLDGTEVFSEDAGITGGPLQGTQQDLVVNIGDRVFFGYDRYDLSEEARATLDRQANWMNQYPSVNVTIEGHCDERGTREYNLALGERRASSVKNYLIALGVDPRRINTISYGKEQPAVLGSDPASWAQNRRGVSRVE